MRLVVTGAAGFIGSHLCDALVADGHDVVGVDWLAGPPANLTALSGTPRFTLHRLDVCDPAARDAFAGADAVVHLAGQGGARLPDAAGLRHANVGPALATIEAAAHHDVPRVLLASSSSVYGGARRGRREDDVLRARSPYARAKLAAEREASDRAAALGVALVTLRYFSVYGPRQRPDMAFARYIDSVRTGATMPVYGAAARRRQFTYVSDAVSGTLAALRHGRDGVTYNVAGPSSVLVSDAFALLADLLGAPARVEHRRPPVPEPGTTRADLSRAATELGWAPEVGLAEGLARQVEAAAVAQAA